MELGDTPKGLRFFHAPFPEEAERCRPVLKAVVSCLEGCSVLIKPSRAQDSPSSPLPPTLACLTTFRTRLAPSSVSCPCPSKARLRLATRAALLRATTDWRDIRAGHGPLRGLPPLLASESVGFPFGASPEEKTWGHRDRN